jgi:hypothetical protein
VPWQDARCPPSSTDRASARGNQIGIAHLPSLPPRATTHRSSGSVTAFALSARSGREPARYRADDEQQRRGASTAPSLG